MNNQAAACKKFRDLHSISSLLVLPNAWDAGSARLMESLGASAIATTSSGAAWAHGYADGNKLPIEIHAATVRDIARAVQVPITVDAEAGYSTDAEAVGPVIAQLIEAGAVGINIEDGFESPEITCAKIEAARKAGARAGDRLVRQ